MRLSLSSYGTIPCDDPTVVKFLSHVSLPESGQLEFVPQAPDKEWITQAVRHKVRRAYLYGKKNFLVTMTTVKSYEVKSSDIGTVKESILTVVGNDWKEHHEIEVSS